MTISSIVKMYRGNANVLRNNGHPVSRWAQGSGGGKPYQGQRKLIRLRKASGLGIGVAGSVFLCYIDSIVYTLHSGGHFFAFSSSGPSMQVLRSRNARLSDMYYNLVYLMGSTPRKPSLFISIFG